jgi:hypothetical protein
LNGSGSGQPVPIGSGGIGGGSGQPDGSGVDGARAPGEPKPGDGLASGDGGVNVPKWARREAWALATNRHPKSAVGVGVFALSGSSGDEHLKSAVAAEPRPPGAVLAKDARGVGSVSVIVGVRSVVATLIVCDDSEGVAEPKPRPLSAVLAKDARGVGSVSVIVGVRSLVAALVACDDSRPSQDDRE